MVHPQIVNFSGCTESQEKICVTKQPTPTQMSLGHSSLCLTSHTSLRLPGTAGRIRLLTDVPGSCGYEANNYLALKCFKPYHVCITFG